jgi:hypothetical protein
MCARSCGAGVCDYDDTMSRPGATVDAVDDDAETGSGILVTI